MSSQHVFIFIKAQQVPLLAASDRKRAIAKHPLGIDQMPNNFADAPLALCIAKSFAGRRNFSLCRGQVEHPRSCWASDRCRAGVWLSRVFDRSRRAKEPAGL